MSAHRPFLKVVVTVASIAALLAPAVVALATGWIKITFTAWSEQPGPDPTPIEAWVLLTLVYLVWTPVVVAGLVAALDRLGYKYSPHDAEQRPSRNERRRRAATMRFLHAREAPPAGAPPARPKRGASPSRRDASSPSRDAVPTGATSAAPGCPSDEPRDDD